MKVYQIRVEGPDNIGGKNRAMRSRNIYRTHEKAQECVEAFSVSCCAGGIFDLECVTKATVEELELEDLP